jgi:preprotein translocase subunit SecG
MAELLSSALPYIQAILSVLLIVAVILQQTGSSMGALGGASGDDAVHFTRRGAEKTLFQATIVLAVLFVASALIALVI